MTLRTHDENVMVSAFEQGVAPGSFCDSFIRNPTETFSEITQRAVAHINAEETVLARNNGLHSRLSRSREESKASRPVRVNETSAGKKPKSRQHPYRKGGSKERSKDEVVRPKLRVSYKELIAIPEITKKLRFPRRLTGTWGEGKTSDLSSIRG